MPPLISVVPTFIVHIGSSHSFHCKVLLMPAISLQGFLPVMSEIFLFPEKEYFSHKPCRYWHQYIKQ